jgi:hypothetical protein
VHSRDRRTWEARERWRRRSEEAGGCGIRYEVHVYCGPVVNGVRLDQPRCRTADECVEQILEEYKREVERLREPPKPPPHDPAEELLREWPKLRHSAWSG